MRFPQLTTVPRDLSGVGKLLTFGSGARRAGEESLLSDSLNSTEWEDRCPTNFERCFPLPDDRV